jgi:hypothetical protein
MRPMRNVWYTGGTELDTHSAMTVDRNADLEAAMQYLSWALEHVEKAGDQEAASQVRQALEALRKGARRSSDSPDKSGT